MKLCLQQEFDCKWQRAKGERADEGGKLIVELETWLQRCWKIVVQDGIDEITSALEEMGR